jgi:hypothetical protein
MFFNRFWKHTLGLRAQVFIPLQLEYTVHADFKTFVANAVHGEFGMYNAATQALIPGSVTPSADTVKLFFALKRGSRVFTSNPFLRGTTKSRTAYVAPVLQVSTLTGNNQAVAVGDYYEIKITDLTPAQGPYPTYQYPYTVKLGDTLTLDGVCVKLRAIINDAASFLQKDRDLIVTAAGANDDITLTARNIGDIFKVTLRSKAYAGFALTETTKTNVGVGYPAHVRLLEAQGDICWGLTTADAVSKYATPADFGFPTSTVIDGVQYNIYDFSFDTEERIQGPAKMWKYKQRVIVACPANGAARPEEEIKYAFGL